MKTQNADSWNCQSLLSKEVERQGNRSTVALHAEPLRRMLTASIPHNKYVFQNSKLITESGSFHDECVYQWMEKVDFVIG